MSLFHTAMHTEHIDYWHHPGLAGIALSQADLRQFSFDKHVHLDYHLGVVTRGGQGFIHRGCSYRLGQQGISTLNPDETHDGQSLGEEGYHVKVMSLPYSMMQTLSGELGLGRVHFEAPMVEDPQLYQYFIRLHWLLTQGHSSNLAAQTHLLNFVQLTLQRHLGGPRRQTSKASGLSESQLALCKQQFHDEPWQNYQLETLAAEVGLSKFQFLRQFKHSTGITPHAYLKRLRLEYAKKSLMQGDRVGQVAQQVGFFDQSHFNKAFKQAFLVSPRQFQQRML
ncbi:AraC family transcriptional regulator [Shewanella sp. AS16]|uniref:AraC family transcriptional regulator n=1 Tax=Shewanella sp. AS16 TaxID=2907625 RepID=UPI001F3E4DD5|nr:AraC family transcriptional regulator [Shewanella sp. AS16]MCE9687119.1 AraC family transcriptional regulator [Shewanella sp. AS16]